MTHPSTTQLDAQLHDLHLGAVLEEYRAQAEAAAHAGWPYTAYLAEERTDLNNLSESEPGRWSR